MVQCFPFLTVNFETMDSNGTRFIGFIELRKEALAECSYYRRAYEDKNNFIYTQMVDTLKSAVDDFSNNQDEQSLIEWTLYHDRFIIPEIEEPIFPPSFEVTQSYMIPQITALQKKTIDELSADEFFFVYKHFILYKYMNTLQQSWYITDEGIYFSENFLDKLKPCLRSFNNHFDYDYSYLDEFHDLSFGEGEDRIYTYFIFDESEKKCCYTNLNVFFEPGEFVEERSMFSKIADPNSHSILIVCKTE